MASGKANILTICAPIPLLNRSFRIRRAVAFANGERLTDVQQRGVQAIEIIRQTYPQGIVVMVSHGDVIRTVLAHYLNMPFNEYRLINRGQWCHFGLRAVRRLGPTQGPQLCAAG